MDITEVRVFPVDEEKLKAYASIVLDACFIVNDLKIIECRQLIARMLGEPSVSIGFEEGILIERTIAAMARSFQEGKWVEVAQSA